ncbi:hypothetical protein BB558_001846 [Smittium angustum]|uniref:Rab-GAP TBC domain-containing protein n=1 Tax=Smittium angustum TaxID=133377 RepID=A0A2U1JA86_SMIAN|nr:hypothetical protein BB558_001846 [Smittium angustum]
MSLPLSSPIKSKAPQTRFSSSLSRNIRQKASLFEQNTPPLINSSTPPQTNPSAQKISPILPSQMQKTESAILPNSPPPDISSPSTFTSSPEQKPDPDSPQLQPPTSNTESITSPTDSITSPTPPQTLKDNASQGIATLSFGREKRSLRGPKTQVKWKSANPHQRPTTLHPITQNSSNDTLSSAISPRPTQNSAQSPESPNFPSTNLQNPDPPLDNIQIEEPTFPKNKISLDKPEFDQNKISLDKPELEQNKVSGEFENIDIPQPEDDTKTEEQSTADTLEEEKHPETLGDSEQTTAALGPTDYPTAEIPTRIPSSVSNSKTLSINSDDSLKDKLSQKNLPKELQPTNKDTPLPFPHSPDTGSPNTFFSQVSSIFSKKSGVPITPTNTSLNEPRKSSISNSTNSFLTHGVFGSIGEWIGKSTTNERPSRTSHSPSLNSEHENIDPSVELLLSQIEAQNRELLDNPKSAPFAKQELQRQLLNSRNTMKQSGKDNDIDWEFWGQLINNYEQTAKTKASTLTKSIHNGIPQEIRGTVWQLLSGSRRDPSLLDKYRNLLGKESPHDKQIIRDLDRTFPTHKYFKDENGPGQESLFSVLRSYSQFDTGLGYCQGLAFVVGPLLLNMPEEDAFCVLERLMFSYGLRGHYTPNMESLQCRLYQLDRLIEEHLPALSKHFIKEGVRSTMYASQWFMTLFAYCLPIPLVFRIFDLVFAEGVDVLLQISLALLKRSQTALLNLSFEPLIKYLCGGELFEYYINRPHEAFIHDVESITVVTRKRLERLARDHNILMQKNAQEMNSIMQLKEENSRLDSENKHLLNTLQLLSKEHSELTSQFVQSKLQLSRYNENEKNLEQKIIQLEERLLSERKDAEEELRADMDTLARKNYDLAIRHQALEDKTLELENALIRVNTLYANSENDRLTLETKWNTKRFYSQGTGKISRALAFPGQGSQYIGMGRELSENFTSSRHVFEQVDEALNFKLSKLIFEGEHNVLTNTENAQPAIVAVGIAAVSAIEQETGYKIKELCDYALGHSVGEYTALIAAGGLSLWDGVRLVKLRGEAMKSAIRGIDTSMVAIIMRNCTIEEIKTAVDGISKLIEIEKQSSNSRFTEIDSVEIATINMKNQVTLSGTQTAVDFAIQCLHDQQLAIRAAELPVAAPFHCKLLIPAAKILETEFKNSTLFKKLEIPVIANCTARPISSHLDIPDLLVKQTFSQVKWLDSLLYLVNECGIDRWLCPGPSPVISSMIRKQFPRAITRQLGSKKDILDFANIIRSFDTL